MSYLQDRVSVSTSDSGVLVRFDVPTEKEMIDHGLDGDGVRQMLGADWWAEMASDVVETPEFCDPGEGPDAILGYARDVIVEYVRKRFILE
jgi:hypothetical protein